MSPCGKHYNGVTQTGRDFIVYRCSGRRHRGAAFPRCSCPQLHGLPLEDRVWSEVVGLLGDPDRLLAMAGEWLRRGDQASADDTDDELAAKVARQIERLEKARSKATHELLFTEDDADIRKHLAQIDRDLASAKQRQQALEAMRADAADRGKRLTDLAGLARRASERLRAMPEAQRREVLALLDVRVTVTEAADVAWPSVVIDGRIDPRLFGGGSAALGGPVEPGTPTPGGDGPGGVLDLAGDCAVRALSGAVDADVAGPLRTGGSDGVRDDVDRGADRSRPR
jgi:hypothetical protein